MKTIKSTLAIVTVATLSLASLNAYSEQADAQSPSPNITPSMNKTHDQPLSDDDIKGSQSGTDTKVIRMGFQRLDADDDGTISMEEAAKQSTLLTEFKTVDKNQDSKLSLEEFAKFAEANSDTIQNEERNMPNGNLSGEADAKPEPNLQRQELP